VELVVAEWVEVVREQVPMEKQTAVAVVVMDDQVELDVVHQVEQVVQVLLLLDQ
jgi:hypothetical protein